MAYKSNTYYHGHHKPSGEDWVVMGINEKRNEVCVAGWPPTIAKLSDMEHMEEKEPMPLKDLEYRKKEFGDNWI